MAGTKTSVVVVVAVCIFKLVNHSNCIENQQMILLLNFAINFPLSALNAATSGIEKILLGCPLTDKNISPF